MSKHLHSDQAKAFAEWWGEENDNTNIYQDRKAAFFAGWQASKADSHNHKVVVEYDLATAVTESKLRDKLIEMGWTPPRVGLYEYDDERKPDRLEELIYSGRQRHE